MLSPRAPDRPPPTGGASSGTAAFYDLQLGLERAALRAMIDLVAPARSERVVDLATGTGGLLRQLARRPGRPREVIGVDASAAMLARVPALPDGWRLITADARRVPLPDGAADVATCAYALHLLDAPARAAVLVEIARLLAPGGRAGLITLLNPDGWLGRAVLGPAQHALCRVLGPSSGWCTLDPAPELAAAGLRPLRHRVSRRGYASLCLLVERA